VNGPIVLLYSLDSKTLFSHFKISERINVRKLYCMTEMQVESSCT
jgi:hypothetical protein